MKKLLLFFLSAVCVSSCCECFCPNKQRADATCVREVVDTLGKTRHRVEYKCREVLVDVGTKEGAESAAWLQANGFKPIDSCDCNVNLQLWGADKDVELLTADDKTNSKGKMDGDQYALNSQFFALNYLLDFTTFNVNFFPIDSALIESFTRRVSPPATPKGRVTIAFIDTGIDAQNGQLQPFLWHNPSPGSGCVQQDDIGFNFSDPANPLPQDAHGHGTFVAGVLAGVPVQAGDDFNIALQLMSLKFTDKNTGRGSLYHGVCAMYYAIQNGAKVINLSWGFPAQRPPAVMKPLLQAARQNNVLVVAAAGNRSSNNDQLPYWPAGFANVDSFPDYDVIAVAGLNTAGNALGDYTNYGKNGVNLAAPGEKIGSLGLDNPHMGLTGTSASAPFVSRTAAIIIGLNQANGTPKTPAQVKQCLTGGLLVPLPTTPGPLPLPPFLPQRDMVSSGGYWRFDLPKDCN